MRILQMLLFLSALPVFAQKKGGRALDRLSLGVGYMMLYSPVSFDLRLSNRFAVSIDWLHYLDEEYSLGLDLHIGNRNIGSSTTPVDQNISLVTFQANKHIDRGIYFGGNAGIATCNIDSGSTLVIDGSKIAVGAQLGIHRDLDGSLGLGAKTVAHIVFANTIVLQHSVTANVNFRF